MKYVCKFQGDDLRTNNLLTFCVRECNFPHFHEIQILKMRYLVDASVCFYVRFFVLIGIFLVDLHCHCVMLTSYTFIFGVYIFSVHFN